MKQLVFSLLAFIPFALLGQSPPTTVQEASVGSLSYSEDRIIQLANAFPEDKFNWRPDEGIRSVAESILHVAAGNYFMTMTAGHTPPEGVDIMTLEKSTTDKAEVIAALKESYEYARAGIGNISGSQLEDKVEFPFPGEYNKLSTLIMVAGHSEEHLGQLIAYARMNGITPPWSE